MLSTRLMSASQSKAIAQLDALAFAEYKQQKGWNLSPRTQQNILACLNLNPAGCFVAVAEEPVGFIFSRRWGQLGWIGTFAIHPNFQGQNIGRLLLTAVISHLEQAGCTTIGLETMPDSPYNVGLYARFGFCPISPTLTLEKKLALPAQSAPYMLLSQLPKDEALSAVTQVSQAAWTGLDYAPEAANADEYEWGETLLWGWPQPWAIAIVRTVPKLERTLDPVSEVSALAVHPDACQQFPQILEAVETFACRQKASQISLPINAVNWSALQQTLGYGFRVSRVMQRMIFKQHNIYPAGIELSKWAM